MKTNTTITSTLAIRIKTILSAICLSLFLMFGFAGISFAADDPEKGAATKYTVYDCTNNGIGFPSCTEQPGQTKPVKPTADNNPMLAWIVYFVNMFSVIIISGAAVMLAVAGVQYTTARDNSQAVEAAKKRIGEVVVGILMYVFFYSFIQWLIPGGVF